MLNLEYIDDSYSHEIKEALSEILCVSETAPKHAVKRAYTHNEIFDAVLEYQGLIGYGRKIRNLVKEIYEIDLDKVEV